MCSVFLTVFNNAFKAANIMFFSNGRITVDDELRIWMEASVANFMVLP
jgi:hypothetical protein